MRIISWNVNGLRSLLTKETFKALIKSFKPVAVIASRLKKAFILNEIMGSDHCPVGIELA